MAHQVAVDAVGLAGREASLAADSLVDSAAVILVRLRISSKASSVVRRAAHDAPVHRLATISALT